MLQSNQKIIRHKVGLLNMAEELGNVSKACQMMGLAAEELQFPWRWRGVTISMGLNVNWGMSV